MVHHDFIASYDLFRVIDSRNWGLQPTEMRGKVLDRTGEMARKSNIIEPHVRLLPRNFAITNNERAVKEETARPSGCVGVEIVSSVSLQLPVLL